MNLFTFFSKMDGKVALCPPKLLNPFKLKASRNRVLTIFFTILLTLSTLYSKNLALSFGIGLPELLNVGIGFDVSKTQVNLNAGSAPFWSNEKTYAFSGNLLYPAIQNTLSLKKHTWFGKAGLTYLFDETSNFKDEYLYLNAKFGRRWWLSPKVGTELELGTFFQLIHQRTVKTQGNFNLELPYVIPGLGIRFLCVP